MNSKALLILSVCLNVGLIVGYVVKRGPSSAETAPAHETGTPAKPDSAVVRKVTTVVTNELIKTVDWRAVESEDYKKYIVNLRGIGCPEETIRDIITADVNKLYESKRKELAGQKKKFEFWKPGALMGATLDSERMEKERALNREKRELLTELLGTALDEKPDLLAGAASQLEAMFDFLPPEKRAKVTELMQDMQIKLQKAMKSGAPDPDDMRKLMKESEAAMAGVLTPEELLDYNLRFSMTANTMRMQMAGFEPTEQEFLALFKARKSFDDEFGGAFGAVANLAKDEKARQNTAQKELDSNIKGILGGDRYEEYKRGQDYAYQGLDRVAEKEGLGKDAAVKAYEMKKISEEQANKVRRDTSLTKEQRQAALQGIRGETERSMQQVLGEKGFKSYQNQPNAYWLKGISPDPKP